MGSAIVALALAIAYLWRMQVKQSADYGKKFAKLEEELRKSILARCIRGGGEPRPCIKWHACKQDKSKEETRPFTNQVPFAPVICAMIVLFLSSCLGRTPETTGKTIEQVIAEKVEAEKQRDQAINTSADAKKAAAQARQDAAAAQAVADEKGLEAKRLDKIAKDLQTKEIAAGITRASWWLSGSGVVALAVGVFLFLRLGGKTAISIAVSGAAALGLGIVGLLIAPYWIAWAWGVAIVALLALIGGVVYLLHDYFGAAREVVHGIQGVKDRLFPIKKDGTMPLSRKEVNAVLEFHQKKHRKTIQRIIGKF
jgi:hypothetical protein